jgi:protein-S-isoprenylcysteine O-methyltransferase Ste14
MTLGALIFAAWAAFGAYWLISALGAKEGSFTGRRRVPIVFSGTAFVLLRVFQSGALAVHSPVLQVVGIIVLLSGLGLAVWARIHLGRNWGMPMTRKNDPELVTSGPYRFVRHPIYSGLLLAIVGTALATNFSLLIAAAVLGIYFAYSARVEERMLTASFPAAYAGYRARTKMMIPFVV